jgi:hypothetical protein
MGAQSVHWFVALVRVVALSPAATVKPRGVSGRLQTPLARVQDPSQLPSTLSAG